MDERIKNIWILIIKAFIKRCMPGHTFDILACGRSTCTPTWSYKKPVLVDYCRLYCLHKGSLIVGMDGAPHRLVAPRIYLLPARRWVTGICPRRTEVSWVHFRPLEPKLDLLLTQLRRPIGWNRDLWKSWNHVVDGFYHDTERLNPSIALLVESMILYATGLTLKMNQGVFLSGRRAESLTRLQTTLEYMRQNIKHPLPIAELASQAKVSPAQLNRLFRKALGVPPHQYLIDLRMLRAKQMLRSPSHSIQQIADEVGYCNAFYFSRAFRESTGQSPRQYRQSGLADGP